MRAKEKSAEAIVARKAGNAAGAKGRRTKEQARGATDISAQEVSRSPGPQGPSPGKGNETGSRPKQKRWSRGGPRPVGPRVSVASILTESDARGTGGRRFRQFVVSCGESMPLGPTAGYGKPYVRWCGRVPGRNPRHPTRSPLMGTSERFRRRQGLCQPALGGGLADVR